MTTCISEPVSYLRLERYSLRELPAEEAQRVAEHLAQCRVCRDCYERIEADVRELDLATLTIEPRRPAPATATARLWAALAVAASLACLLFVSRMQHGAPSLEPAHGPSPTTKGDVLALELVRLDERGQQLDPTRFAAGDRFKVLLSCPAGFAGRVRVLAFQEGELFEPTPAQALANCGNRRALAGAWQLSGQGAVDVCAVLVSAADEARGLDLSALHSPEAVPLPHVCARVEPVTLPR